MSNSRPLLRRAVRAPHSKADRRSRRKLHEQRAGPTPKIHRGLKDVYFERSATTSSTATPASCSTAAIRSTIWRSTRPSRRRRTCCCTASCRRAAELEAFDGRAANRAPAPDGRRGHHHRDQARASDGRAAHVGLRARRLRSGGRRQLARGDAAQGHTADRPGGDDRGRHARIRDGKRADTAGLLARARRQLPGDGARRALRRTQRGSSTRTSCSTPSTARTPPRSRRAWSWAPRPISTPR